MVDIVWNNDDAEMLIFSDADEPSKNVEVYQQQDNVGFRVQQWQEEETLFFFNDVEGHLEEQWIEYVSDTRPVVANAPASPVQEDADLNLWEAYEDPEVWTFEWSGPIQPNAPPTVMPPEDAWPHDDWAEDWLGEHNPEDSDPPIGNAPSGLLTVEDPWDFAYDEVEDWTAEQNLEDGDPPTANVVSGPALPEDPWDFAYDEIEYSVTSEGFQNVDAAVVPGSSDLAIQDPPDFTADDEVEDDYYDDFGNADNIPLAIEDAWDHFYEEVEDYTAEQNPEDGDPVNPNAPIVPPMPPEDAWPHDDFAEDEWDGTSDANILNFVPPALYVNIEDPWDWRQDDDDYDWELLHENQLVNFAYVGYKAGPTKLAITGPYTVLTASSPVTILKGSS